MNRSALLAIAAAADVLAIAARAACDDDNDPDEHLTLEEARALGKFKTIRPIKDAGRAGHLALFGTQRSRTVKRGDFLRWLEDRRSPITTGEESPELEKRMQRLAKTRRSPKGSR